MGRGDGRRGVILLCIFGEMMDWMRGEGGLWG